MPDQLFYNATLTQDSGAFLFSPEESKHIVRILRKKEGDTVHITNGEGFLFEAEILVADQRKCKAKIVTKAKQEPRNYKLHLAVAPTKMNDRFEWFLEKATEIGIDEITPILCENSERKHLKIERFERILRAAMKQSLQCYLPKINGLTQFSNFLESAHSSNKLIAHCEDGKKNTLSNALGKNNDVLVLIGPEGDFSPEEISMALKKNFIPISLGDTRLRTETAAVVACTLVAHKYNG